MNVEDISIVEEWLAAAPKGYYRFVRSTYNKETKKYYCTAAQCHQRHDGPTHGMTSNGCATIEEAAQQAIREWARYLCGGI